MQHLAAFLFLAVGGLVTACGGSSSGSGQGTVGGAENGGEGNLKPAEAAVGFAVSPPVAPESGWSCPTPAHSTSFGVAPTETSQGQTVVDGLDGAEVDCTVSALDGSYAIVGSVTIKGPGEEEGPLFGVAAQLSASGEGTGTVNVDDATTLFQLSASAGEMPCTFTVKRGSLAIESGAVWAAFECPKMTNPGQPGIWCAVSGVFLLKVCGV